MGRTNELADRVENSVGEPVRETPPPAKRAVVAAYAGGTLALVGWFVSGFLRVFDLGERSLLIDAQLGLLLTLSALAALGALSILWGVAWSVRMHDDFIEQRLGPLRRSVRFGPKMVVRRGRRGHLIVEAAGEVVRVDPNVGEIAALERELALKALELGAVPLPPLELRFGFVGLEALAVGTIAALGVAAFSASQLTPEARAVAVLLWLVATVAAFGVSSLWGRVSIRPAGVVLRFGLRRRELSFDEVHGFVEEDARVTLVPTEGPAARIWAPMATCELPPALVAGALESLGLTRLTAQEVSTLRPEFETRDPEQR